MKVFEKGTNRLAEAQIWVDNCPLPCDEYGEFVADDGASCCFVPVELNQRPKVFMVFSGTTNKVQHDVYVDGVLRAWKINQTTVVKKKTYKGDIDKFRFRYDKEVKESEIFTTALPDDLDIVEGEAQIFGVIEVRTYVVRRFEDTHEIDKSETYHEHVEDGNEEVETAGYAKIPPSMRLTHERNNAFMNRRTAREKLHQCNDARPGKRPWTVFRFYYRTLQSIRDAGLHETFSQDHQVKAVPRELVMEQVPALKVDDVPPETPGKPPKGAGKAKPGPKPKKDDKAELDPEATPTKPPAPNMQDKSRPSVPPPEAPSKKVSSPDPTDEPLNTANHDHSHDSGKSASSALPTREKPAPDTENAQLRKENDADDEMDGIESTNPAPSPAPAPVKAIDEKEKATKTNGVEPQSAQVLKPMPFDDLESEDEDAEASTTADPKTPVKENNKVEDETNKKTPVAHISKADADAAAIKELADLEDSVMQDAFTPQEPITPKKLFKDPAPIDTTLTSSAPQPSPSKRHASAEPPSTATSKRNKLQLFPPPSTPTLPNSRHSRSPSPPSSDSLEQKIAHIKKIRDEKRKEREAAEKKHEPLEQKLKVLAERKRELEKLEREVEMEERAIQEANRKAEESKRRIRELEEGV
ncbi:hypothetical protein BCR34DRAFT_607209 [Clohesyomyces aquaticus]|uniref:Uncharacterized protein n=1 Tax=Clohesyomyces aquaticus TaxID=1231657 RepID=A0A1Y1YI05_9PLEO|nr:hypothetical protein BCR34DRAFT_607209 [Clohesyomyces aquaticus]